MMPVRLSRRALLGAAPLLAGPMGGGTAAADFNGFLAGVRADAVAQGVRAATVDLAMRYIRFLPKVIELDQRQPERTRTFSEIVARSVTPQRKEDVRQHLAENAQLLQR